MSILFFLIFTLHFKHSGEKNKTIFLQDITSDSFENSQCQLFSHVKFFATPWTVACQTLLSMGFSRQEYQGGLPLASPGNLPDPRIKYHLDAKDSTLHFTTLELTLEHRLMYDDWLPSQYLYLDIYLIKHQLNLHRKENKSQSHVRYKEGLKSMPS